MNHIAFKTRQEIANELNISYKTLIRMLKRSKINIPKNRLLAPSEYAIIYKQILPQEKQ